MSSVAFPPPRLPTASSMAMTAMISAAMFLNFSLASASARSSLISEISSAASAASIVVSRGVGGTEGIRSGGEDRRGAAGAQAAAGG
jgi:hypothetical protein